MNNLIKHFAILLLFQLSCKSWAQTSGMMEIVNGLYYGESKYMMQVNTYFINVNDSVAQLEEFFPFKGATFKNLDIALEKENTNEQRYINEKFVFLKEGKKLILKCLVENCKTGPGNSVRMKPVKMVYAPEKIKELNILSNKAYLTSDYYVKMKKYFGEGDRDSCEQKYTKLKFNYGVFDLAEKLTHKDFVIKFEEIKVHILDDIKKCQKELGIQKE